MRQERQSSDIQPVSQIAPGSYLGQAMNRIEENEQVPSSPSDSSSGFSKSSSSDGRASDSQKPALNTRPIKSPGEKIEEDIIEASRTIRV